MELRHGTGRDVPHGSDVQYGLDAPQDTRLGLSCGGHFRRPFFEEPPERDEARGRPEAFAGHFFPGYRVGAVEPVGYGGKPFSRLLFLGRAIGSGCI